ncbi:hypothetical protein GZH49_01025 [Nocardia terpenica]|uniref:hypothetical protein n=1 Tax=Nocardia terpenica TaxID=455432 RepID=UPI002FE3D549
MKLLFSGIATATILIMAPVASANAETATPVLTSQAGLVSDGNIQQIGPRVGVACTPGYPPAGFNYSGTNFYNENSCADCYRTGWTWINQKIALAFYCRGARGDGNHVGDIVELYTRSS